MGQGTRGEALRGFELKTVLRWVGFLHVLRSGRRHGVGRQGRREDGAKDYRRHQPGGERTGYDSRRFLHEVGRNVIHGSDAVESANHEIALWFPEGVCEYESCAKAWIYE